MLPASAQHLPEARIYIPGEAYLAAHQGKEAAAEFQKILDHRGLVLNESASCMEIKEFCGAPWPSK